MPGYKISYADLCAVNPRYICASCGLLLRDPLQTSCGDLHCQTCLSNLQRQENPVCLMCGVSLEAQTVVFPDAFVKREILELITTCLNKGSGCNWHGRVREFEVHEGICPYRPVKCKHNGCCNLIPSCNLQDHEDNCCPYRPVQCEYCNSPETVGGLPNHLTVCPDFPIDCPNCGHANLPRSQMKCHLDPINGDCPRMRCPFGGYGCAHEELMDQDGLKRHLKDGITEHHLLLLRVVDAKYNHDGGECGLASKESKFRQALTATEVEVKSHEWALNVHYKWLAKLGGDVKALFDSLALAQAQVLENCEEFRTKIAALSEENAELRGRLEEVEAQSVVQENRMNVQLEFTRAMVSTVLRNYQQLPRQEQVYSYDGQLIWKIDDVCQKCAEARDNPDSFLSSPPFYTSRDGYKMCVRLHLNGYGRDRGSRMSLFFVVMEGEYDPILEWPFSRHTEVRLMGQAGSRGDDVVAHVQPHPGDASFAQPVQDMNQVPDPGAEPHCSIPLDNLSSGAFVRGDAMFVKVLVREK